VSISQNDNTRSAPMVEQCWKAIGVMGDGSCEKLATSVHCRNCPVFTEAGQQLFERAPPAAYLKEQTALLSEEVAEEAVDSEAMIVFRLEEEWLALDVEAVVEVAEPRPVHRVPHRSNRLLMGIVNIRGELQLCVSLHALMGIGGTDQVLEREADEPVDLTCRLLVCQRGEQRWVFAVDEVAGVQRVAIDQLGNVPSTIAKSVKRQVKAVFRWDEKSVGRLDADRLFASLEETIG
jgi:chemotaxis-related protein WspD